MTVPTKLLTDSLVSREKHLVKLISVAVRQKRHRQRYSVFTLLWHIGKLALGIDRWFSVILRAVWGGIDRLNEGGFGKKKRKTKNTND